MPDPLYKPHRPPSTALAGHSLIGEGAPHNAHGSRLQYWGSGGEGRGKCSCGAVSAPLHSGMQRKQWHRDHKTKIRNSKENN